MRKLIVLALVLTMVLSVSGTVFADVIWFPMGNTLRTIQNAYTENHRESFVECPSEYITVGQTRAFNAPDGGVQFVMPAGERFCGEALCTAGGKTWIVGYTARRNRWTVFYVDYDSVIDCYDWEFVTDFASELRTELPEELEDVSWQQKEIFCWSYPGGKAEIFSSGDYSLYEVAGWCSQFYVDPQGDVWGLQKEHWQDKNWFCISAPYDPCRKGVEIPAELLPSPPQNHWDWTMILPVAALVGSAGLLLLWPKRKKENAAE